MKRKWAYLGAALPLSMAVSTWATAEASKDDAGKMSRSKSGLWQDEEDKKSAAADDSPPDKESPGIKAPPRDAYGDDGPRAQLDGGLGELTGVGSPGVQVSVPGTDGSMYAPAAAHGSGHLQFAGGSGGSLAKIELLNEEEEEEGEQSTPEVVPTTDTPPAVEPELSDTDAMLILLGGMAEAGGSNSTSSGEMVLDIVDYGAITIGYGYAKYMASGGGAHADTFVDVTGADLVFSYDAEDSEDGTASSSVYVIAVDFEEGMEEQAAAGDLNWMELLAQGPFAQWAHEQDDDDTFVDGNFSMFTLLGQASEDEAPSGLQLATHSFEDAGSTVLAAYDSDRGDLSLHAEAQGFDTLTAAEGYLIIEDHFSSVGGSLMGVA